MTCLEWRTPWFSFQNMTKIQSRHKIVSQRYWHTRNCDPYPSKSFFIPCKTFHSHGRPICSYSNDCNVAWCWSCQWSCKLSPSIAIMGKIRYSVKTTQTTQTTHAWNPSNLTLYIYWWQLYCAYLLSTWRDFIRFPLSYFLHKSLA